MLTREQQIAVLQADWDSNPRWSGICRNYSAAEVIRLRSALGARHAVANNGALKLWNLLHKESFVNALGARNGNEAVQQVKAGLKAIYVGPAGVEVDPGQALNPANSVNLVLQRIHHALAAADGLQRSDSSGEIDYFAPIIVDAQAGLGAACHPYEFTQSLIAAGAAGVHVDDQLAAVSYSPKRKILLSTSAAVEKLNAARLAADVLGVPTVLLARTDAETADLIISAEDAADQPFLTGERTVDGYHKTRSGLEQAVARGLAYAPYADMIWCETDRPDLDFARQFAHAIHASFPGKLLAYNCSSSFNWKENLDDATIAKFQKELGRMGYQFQFTGLAGFSGLNDTMFKLAHGYVRRQMSAFVELHEA